MEEELLKEYKKLSLDNKRNIYNKEIVLIGSLIINLLNNYDREKREFPYNYNPLNDNKKTEDEFLLLNYKELLRIKNNLLLLLSYEQANK